MKVFIASLLILALLIAGGIAADIYLCSIADDMSGFADMVDSAAFGGNFDGIREAYTQMMQYWDKNEKFLSALIDHSHTVEVGKALKELEVSLKAQEEMEILLANAKVRTEVESISNDEHFHLKNIL